MIAVSACLAGCRCRYDGDSKTDQEIVALVKTGNACLICPEQLGGLPTPRPPAELVGDRVINNKGEDVTEYFERGAKATLALLRDLGVKQAILKAHSPSCGCSCVYDGSFTGTLIPGMGLTARLLSENGISVAER